MNGTNEMTELIRLADIASTKSDRWFFAAAMIVLLVFTYSVIRWLVREVSAARTAYSETLQNVIKDQHQMTIDMKISLDRNTEALKTNNRLLEEKNT